MKKSGRSQVELEAWKPLVRLLALVGFVGVGQTLVVIVVEGGREQNRVEPFE